MFLYFLKVAPLGATFFVFGGGDEREGIMEEKNGEKALQQRIRRGELRRQDVARRLAELAFGKANDCVRLVLEEGAPLKKLDLSLLSEVKRNDKGTVEVKLIDRLKALEHLAVLAQEDGADLESFLQALQGGEEG